ncbi:MAG: hypothetical protein JSS89_06205 [Bacteroidetes bacterium]|nr:hypothetical protein [Bacteroidota bacterium]
MIRAILIALISAGTLCSCLPFVSDYATSKKYLVLDSLRKGMPQTEVRRILSAEFESDTTVAVTDGDRTFRVDQYWLPTKRYKIRLYTGSGMNGQQSSSLDQLHEVQIPMLVLFDDGALRYWGTVEDFWQTEDQAVARLAPILDEEFSRAQ